MKPQVYFDNAATSRTKPACVIKAMTDYLQDCGCSPGRGGYECSLQAGRLVLEARLAISKLFGAPNPEQVVFCPNATYALNLALKGLLRPGDHVITTSLEHNSVIRPLRALEAEGKISVTVIGAESDGTLDLD